VPETRLTSSDLLLRRWRKPGMIRRWRCGWSTWCCPSCCAGWCSALDPTPAVSRRSWWPWAGGFASLVVSVAGTRSRGGSCRWCATTTWRWAASG